MDNQFSKTRTEAKELLLSGKKISHQYFTDDEFIIYQMQKTFNTNIAY